MELALLRLAAGRPGIRQVLVLWLLVAATTLVFWWVRRLAGALLVPYLLWVGFAAALNFSVWQLNPEALGS